MKLFTKVNNSYFLNTWPANRWLFNHISLDIWFTSDFRYFYISPSSANNDNYFCLNFYLGPVNISYTWIK